MHDFLLLPLLICFLHFPFLHPRFLSRHIFLPCIHLVGHPHSGLLLLPLFQVSLPSIFKLSDDDTCFSQRIIVSSFYFTGPNSAWLPRFTVILQPVSYCTRIYLHSRPTTTHTHTHRCAHVMFTLNISHVRVLGHSFISLIKFLFLSEGLT